MDLIGKAVDEFVRLNKEHTEKTLAEIIANYDFIVGSMECKHKLMEVLPKEAKIVYSPYIVNPNMIYAIKKFDILDVLKESEVEK